MIRASSFLKNYIRMHGSNEVIAARWDVSRQTVHNVLNDRQGFGSLLLSRILKDTGFKFDQAFVVKEEGSDGNERESKKSARELLQDIGERRRNKAGGVRPAGRGVSGEVD